VWANALPGDSDPQAFASPPRGAPAQVRVAYENAAEDAFQRAMLVTAALIALGGALSAIGIVNPKRSVPCETCPGGAAVGASQDAGHVEPVPVGAAAR